MDIEISISEACKIIEKHFKDKGYFINYDDRPICFEKVQKGYGDNYRFFAQLSLRENKESNK